METPRPLNPEPLRLECPFPKCEGILVFTAYQIREELDLSRVPERVQSN